MRIIFTLALVALALSSAFAAEPERFIQDRFAIGFWVDPPLDDRAEARYAELATANFTLVIGGFGASTPEALTRQLDLCAKHDLKALVHLPGESGSQVSAHPACWGFGLRDEPSAADFAVLRQQVDSVREAHPGKLAYINLFPTYANETQLGTATYDEHVRRFIEEVRPDVLSFDHYPLMTPTADRREGYCENLAIIRKHALDAGIPFWNFFNIMPYGPHFDPTEAQVRWQIYTSIAYGAKGVLYFCYYTPAGGEFPKGGAIIARDDRPTRHYGQAQRINAALKNFGPTLMQLTSTGVRRLPRGEAFDETLDGAGITHITDGDYLLGEFAHADGRRAALLVNYDMAYTIWPTVTFDTDLPRVLEVSPVTGEAGPVRDDSPDTEGLQVSLDSGEGRLFLLPGKP
jgi:hypothetical protein